MESRQCSLEGVVMSGGFWQGKRVFLTGHTGFKGGWLALWLQQLGAEVTGYALHPPTQPSIFEAGNVAKGMHSIIGDVCDVDGISKAVSEVCPEIVFHMAAQSLVRYSYANPVETYATNIMGLVHLLEAVRVTGTVRSVVNVTSDKCYENKEWVWGYRENEVMGGYDPYSSSKGCAELITACYRNSYFNAEKHGEHGMSLASARAGNVIGGGDWAQDRLIPDIICAISKGEPVQIRNPDSIRPWQHVLEPLAGYLILAEKLFTDGSEYAEGWNFGPLDSESRSVRWVIDQFTQAWGQGASWVQNGQPQPHEATQLKLDCSKARCRLEWKPRWSAIQSIDKIVEWHKAYNQSANMRQITLAQIEAYENS